MRQQSADRAAELLLDAYGVGKHGMANGKVQLDPSVIPRVVDGLSTRGLAETHIAPLVNKLRSAGVHMPSSVLSATIRGVATEVKGKEQTKDAVEVPPWRRRNMGSSNSPNMARTLTELHLIYILINFI